jgi:hypothetical protein
MFTELLRVLIFVNYRYRREILSKRVFSNGSSDLFKNDNIRVDGRLCGPVVRVPGYRSRGPGAIPGATRFFF